MEYQLVLKNPFQKAETILQLSSGGVGGFWGIPGNLLRPFSPYSFRAPFLAPQPTRFVGFASRQVYDHLNYAVYYVSAKGGVDFDYYRVDNRTLVYDRRINWAYWAPDELAVTAAQLKEICPPASLVNINKHLTYLNETMKKYQINTRLRQAHFLAQVSVESDHFRTAREYASGAAYEGRADLGNTQKGDGKRFRGRGLIQLTGRSVYTAYGHYMSKNFTDDANVSLVEEEPYASDSAGWFWLIFKKGKDINARADRDDVVAVTRAVNGGRNGLSERIKYTANAKKVFGIK